MIDLQNKTIKAITIVEPWASLIACGAKKIETRSWSTQYRGPIAIHAGKHFFSPWASELPDNFPKLPASILWPEDNDMGALADNWNELPRGNVIAIADLVDCLMIEKESDTVILVRLYKPSYGISRDGKRYQHPQMCSIKPLTDEQELAFGDFTAGRYAWMLENVRRIDPVPAKGMQRLWNWKMPT